MKKTLREQIQGGIDARLAFQDEERRIKAAAGARMLGLDGTSVAEAARQARCAGGPPLEVLEEQIRVRRLHPDEPGRVVA